MAWPACLPSNGDHETREDQILDYNCHPASDPGSTELFHPSFARDALRFETNRAPVQTGFTNSCPFVQFVSRPAFPLCESPPPPRLRVLPPWLAIAYAAPLELGRGPLRFNPPALGIEIAGGTVNMPPGCSSADLV